MRSRWVLITSATLLLFAATGAAEPISPAMDLARGEQELATALSSEEPGKCSAACRALASMESAAARLCELDLGPRCVEARGKVQEARRRVLAACPACVVAPLPSPGTTSPMPAVPPDESPRAAPHADTASSVASEHKRGGCAGCATSPARGPREGAYPLAFLLGLFLLGTRARRRGGM